MRRKASATTGTLTPSRSRHGTPGKTERRERLVREGRLATEEGKQPETLVTTETIPETLRTPERAGRRPAPAESLQSAANGNGNERGTARRRRRRRKRRRKRRRRRRRRRESGKRKRKGKGVRPTGRRSRLRMTGAMGEGMDGKREGERRQGRTERRGTGEGEDVGLRHLIKVSTGWKSIQILLKSQ